MEVEQKWALGNSGCPLVDTLFLIGQCMTVGINVWRIEDYQNGKMFVGWRIISAGGQGMKDMPQMLSVQEDPRL